MNVKELHQVAWVGDEYVQGPIKAVILVFHGLGYTDLKRDPSADELMWAEAGGLVVFPYYGPWSWMNREARATVDEVVDAVYAAFGLDDGEPLISTGGSMGGLSALLYTRYAAQPIAACVALYPVCDLAYHYAERADLPRTIRHAFAGYPEPMAQLLLEHSPLAQVESMPDIPYLVIHGDADQMVDKARHSDRFVEAMLAGGHDVTYVQVPGMGHGRNVPAQVTWQRIDYVRALLGGRS